MGLSYFFVSPLVLLFRVLGASPVPPAGFGLAERIVAEPLGRDLVLRFAALGLLTFCSSAEIVSSI